MERIIDLDARASDWEIAPGRTLPGWTYNGQVPGPNIEGNVGDVLVVRLTNSLPEPTTIHWHGLRVPSSMDGTDDVQKPVEPGETFEYRFVLPDPGTFWYHPHSNETVQLERGLYGALVVRGPDEPRFDRERVLVFDDVMLDRKTGGFAKFGGFSQKHSGREGDMRLINGRAEPEIIVSAGQLERWRVLNASSARYVLLSLGGKPFRILGTDGGFIERPVTVSEALLVPGDRLDLAVGPFEQGETLAIESLAYGRLHGKGKREPFGTIRVGPPAPSKASVPERLRTIEPLVRGDATPNREVHLGAKMSLKRGLDWVVDGAMHHAAPPVTVGELQVWDVVNDTFIDHPFHLHGFFFQVLEAKGAPPSFLSWEDTINIPSRDRVRIAWMPDDRPGRWMYHCHILEHHEAGMMAHFQVLRPGEEAEAGGAHAHAHHGHHHHH
jgi:FtsP/CotA-like multicopper oxidase with cupredoxin domain